jgi:glucosamine-6-phosphate deaminase
MIDGARVTVNERSCDRMPPMRIEIVADPEAVAMSAAVHIDHTVRTNPRAVLGLPTGNTPQRTYADLNRYLAIGEMKLGEVVAFAIDEFLDAPRGAPGTNAAFFAEAHLDDMFCELHVPNSSGAEPHAMIERFANGIRQKGGLDLCMLGIGTNGHIAFNEPGSTVDSRARVVELTEETRRAHADAFGSLDAVPKRGVTLGIADIFESRAILVMAQGEAKAAIIARAIEEPQTAAVPASWLQGHDDVTWLLDEAAAARLASRGGGA